MITRQLDHVAQCVRLTCCGWRYPKLDRSRLRQAKLRCKILQL